MRRVLASEQGSPRERTFQTDEMKALRLRARGIVPVGKISRLVGRKEEAQQMHYIAFDAHKHYTQAAVATIEGRTIREERVEHERDAFRQFLERYHRGSPVA